MMIMTGCRPAMTLYLKKKDLNITSRLEPFWIVATSKLNEMIARK